MHTRRNRKSRRLPVNIRGIWGFAALVFVGVVGGPTPPVSAGDWLITPSIQGQEIFSDNIFATPTDRRSDFITGLTPDLSINGSSSRLWARLDYSPTVYLYAMTPSQNFIGQNLNASGTATLVPDLFYFDAQAYASMQPATAGLALGGTAFGPSLGATSPNPLATTPNGLVGAAAIPKQQLTQNFAVNASPYLQHRFGDYGIGELRYAFSGNSFGGGQNLALTPGTSASQNGRDITNEGTATFITGSHFDRFKSRVLLDSAQSTGNGVLNDSQRNRAIVATEIPAYHTVSALTTLGYEDLRFSGIPPTHIEDAVWGVGARVSATPDRNLIVMYGRHDGITSPYFALDYALTPLTRLSASYSDSLSTFSQQIAQNLAASDVTASGQTIDARTLLPLEIHNPLVGLQLSLLRIKRGEVSGYIDNRNDHFSLTAYHEEDLVVAEATVNSGTPTRATALIGNWSHDVTPLTTAQLFLGYSWVTLLQTPVVQEQLVSTGASLSYLFNSTLTGTASYTFFNRNANQPSFNLLSNVVLVSLRKTF